MVVQRKSDDDDRDRERNTQLDEELRILKVERDEILNGTNREFLDEIQEVERRKQFKLQVSKDFRAYQMWHLEKTFEADFKFACDQYDIDRAELREVMVKANLERKRRLENLRVVNRRPPRKPGNTLGPGSPVSADKKGKGKNGKPVLRLELTPDEVSNDMESILKGLEATQRLPPQKKLSDRFGRNGPLHGIRSHRGILYYFDQTYGRGQQIEVTVKPQQTKIFGPIKLVNSKEVHIEASKSRTEKVLIANIRSGKCVLRRRPGKL